MVRHNNNNNLGNSIAFVTGAALVARRKEKEQDMMLQIPDQLKKFSDLAKEGIITQEEFESRKAELLALLNPRRNKNRFVKFLKRFAQSEDRETEQKPIHQNTTSPDTVTTKWL